MSRVYSAGQNSEHGKSVINKESPVIDSMTQIQKFEASMNSLGGEDVLKTEKPKEWIKFYRPSELKAYTPPEGHILVGDCHITRGITFVIGGAPGIGKSRAAVALAQAGATGKDWFDLKVTRQFKTMILQNENGRYRLSKEFGDLNCLELDDWVRTSPPPLYGMAFGNPEFIDTLKAAIMDFQPDVFILDPWNSAARDEKAKDYLETFEIIRSLLPTGDNAPALGIVAHTRKPKNDERASGRGLLNLLAGSYVLGSVPRTVFVMQAASDDPQDKQVVWTCCKNNDGDMGMPTAWERRNGLFASVPDFNWEEFKKPADERRTITESDLQQLFADGSRQIKKSHAAAELEEQTGMGRTACYNALNLDGRFASRLKEEGGLLTWS